MIAWTTETNIWFQSTFLYNNWWDVSIMFFLGMAFYRSGFLTGRYRPVVYVTVALIGILLGSGYKFLELKEMYSAGFDDLKLTESGLPIAMNQIRRLFQLSGYVALLILLYRLKPFQWILDLFAPAGKTALSNYLFQSIIAAFLFYGLGLFGKMERYELLEVALGIFAFQLVISRVWLHYFLYGPFEWLWRSLTYNKMQPFVKNATMDEDSIPVSLPLTTEL